MPTTIEKEWAAVDDDDIILKAESKESLENELRRKGYSVEDFELVALPKSHSSMFI